MKHHFGEKILFLIVAAALTGLFFTLPPLGLYSNEEGVKYVQMKNFALHGTLEIPYPGEKLGLGPEVLVKGGGFFSLRDGKIQTLCAPLFPYLASLFYPVFGDRAIHVLPLVFLLLSVAVLSRALALVMERKALYYLLLVAFLLGSPVFLFLFGFSENTAVVFLVTVALYFLVRHDRWSPSSANVFCASLSMGGAVFFSPASLFIFTSFVLAGGIVYCRDKRWRDLAALFGGALAAIAALMISDGLLYGQIPGPYLADFFHEHPLSETRLALFTAIIALGYLIPFIARRAGLGITWVSGMSFLIMILLVTAVLVTSAHHSVVPFVLAFPAFLFSLSGVSGHFGESEKAHGSLGLILAGTALFCLMLASSVVRPNAWTALHACLPTVPVTICVLGLCGAGVMKYGGMRAVLVFAAAIAFINGLDAAKTDYWPHTMHNARQAEFLKQNSAAGDVIIFDNRGSMEHAGPLFFDRIFLVARSREIGPLLERLREKGVKQCHVWTRDARLRFQLGNPYDDRKAVIQASQSACGSCGSSSVGGFALLHVNLDRPGTVGKTKLGSRGQQPG